MPALALTLAAILVALPLSYGWLISVVGPFVFEVLWQSVGTIVLVQLGLTAACLVLWPLAKITEKLHARWPDAVRALGIGALVVFVLLAFVLDVTGDRRSGCGPVTPQSPCADFR